MHIENVIKTCCITVAYLILGFENSSYRADHNLSSIYNGGMIISQSYA